MVVLCVGDACVLLNWKYMHPCAFGFVVCCVCCTLLLQQQLLGILGLV
jgi:hypothetical protein